jgi:hypothetical protein
MLNRNATWLHIPVLVFLNKKFPLASEGMDAVASSARHRDVASERCVKKVIIYLD